VEEQVTVKEAMLADANESLRVSPRSGRGVRGAKEG
jgi:hypothetical protein